MGKLFCGLIMTLGVGTAARHAGTLSAAWQLHEAGQPVTAEVTGLRIDRPDGRNYASVNRVTVNGVGWQHPREWMKTYMLEVSYTLDGTAETADAPVSRDVWHDLAKGESVTVVAAPGVAYVDAEDQATLFYGLQRIGIGAFVALVGLIAFRLDPGGE
ncbi:MAG: hypothetical protein AAFT19_02890 [Pseudomonadota bacterium]